MFDNLIRRDPRDSGKTIIPDLAHSWEIAKDGKTYTFHLRQGVQFHDGTDFTSADVKATFDRIAKPPSGVSIPRAPLFRAVGEINARDKHTVEFKLAAPRSVNFMMSAFASGWNVIYSKKALEENNYDLRKILNIPGTGPFKTRRRVRTRSGLWREIRTTGTRACPISTVSNSTISCRSRRSLGPPCCRAGWIMPARSTRHRPKGGGNSGLSTAKFYQSVIHATWLNAKRKPFDDPRVGAPCIFCLKSRFWWMW